MEEMMSPDRRTLALETIAREAMHLDEQDWDAWLDLYMEDAVLWVPTWRTETELCQDPSTELSFMYLEGRASLRERVRRVVSGRSVASLPIPRTAHLVSAGTVKSDDDGQTACVKSAWSVHVHQHKDDRLMCYAGRYEHMLRWVEGTYRIERKKIVLINDYLQSQLDFFYL